MIILDTFGSYGTEMCKLSLFCRSDIEKFRNFNIIFWISHPVPCSLIWLLQVQPYYHSIHMIPNQNLTTFVENSQNPLDHSQIPQQNRSFMHTTWTIKPHIWSRQKPFIPLIYLPENLHNPFGTNCRVRAQKTNVSINQKNRI